MTKSVIMSGSGGQGVMLMGKILAQAGMMDGYNVTWFPSYGAEMRGGTANCTVVVSDDVIGSPVVGSPDYIVALNCASRDRFISKLKDKGVMIVERAEVDKGECCRAGIACVRVPAMEIAAQSGARRAANMVMLGALVGMGAIVSRESAERAIKAFSDAKSHDINLNAFRKGIDFNAC